MVLVLQQWFVTVSEDTDKWHCPADRGIRSENTSMCHIRRWNVCSKFHGKSSYRCPYISLKAKSINLMVALEKRSSIKVIRICPLEIMNVTEVHSIFVEIFQCEAVGPEQTFIKIQPHIFYLTVTTRNNKSSSTFKPSWMRRVEQQ